jgi:hypothetical protein
MADIMAMKIKSNAPVWYYPTANNWNSTGVVDLADEFSSALQSANDVIAAARTIGLSPQIDVTQFEINEFGRHEQLMSDSTNSIHYEVDELIDNPFARELSALLDRVYALNPEDLVVNETDDLGNTVSYGLGMLLSALSTARGDLDLQNDFLSKFNKLNNDTVPLELKDVVGDALYWQHEYEKAHQINQIMNAVFTDKIRADWEAMDAEERRLILERYAIGIGAVYGDGVNIITGVNYDPRGGSAYGYVNSFQDENHIVVDRDGILYINIQYWQDSSEFSLDHAISTITHEARHQYQQAVSLDTQGIQSDRADVSSINPPIDTPSRLAMDWSDLNSYNSENRNDPSSYWLQPIEIDARAFAGLSVA